MSNKIDLLYMLLKPVVEVLDCNLWGIEYLSQGKHSILRVYIDKDTGVLIDDCERVSRQVSAVLDVEDPIKNEYTLEVSSRGLDSPLFEINHYSMYLNKKVYIKLRVPYQGRRQFKGCLLAVDEIHKLIEIEVDKESFKLSHDLIERANVVSNV